MPMTQVTLVAGVVASVPLGVPAGRVIVTVSAGTAAEVYVTADGSAPVVPTSGVEVSGTQVAIPAVLGAQTVVVPLLATVPGEAGPSGRSNTTVQLVSAGTPTVNVTW